MWLWCSDRCGDGCGLVTDVVAGFSDRCGGCGLVMWLWSSDRFDDVKYRSRDHSPLETFDRVLSVVVAPISPACRDYTAP